MQEKIHFHLFFQGFLHAPLTLRGGVVLVEKHVDQDIEEEEDCVDVVLHVEECFLGVTHSVQVGCVVSVLERG